MTKEELYYCKMNDTLYKNKEEHEQRSKVDYACLLLTNLVEECCVCNEHNNVKTTCSHNICRICFRKLERKMYCLTCEANINYISCPLCRKVIKADCSHFFS